MIDYTNMKGYDGKKRVRKFEIQLHSQSEFRDVTMKEHLMLYVYGWNALYKKKGYKNVKILITEIK